jgi:FtsH-binding integral membrane protein
MMKGDHDMDYPLPASQIAAGQTNALTRVYAWMTAGLALTGAVAALTLRSQALLDFIYGNVLVFWGLLILELVAVFTLSSSISRLSPGAATALFLAYAALNGVTFAAILMFYTGASIASTFFITAGTFAAMSVYGATTKRDLSPLGTVAVMSLIGLILAILVDLFLRNDAVNWIVSFLGVLIFVALTAADTQRIRRVMAEADATGVDNRAILGALTLYLDFVNLFLFLLQLFGQGEAGNAQS